MTEVTTIAEQVLDTAGKLIGDAEVEVAVDRSETALTRFANSFIHQNVADDVTTIRLRAHADGRTVALSSTLTTDAGLAALVDRTAAALRLAPADPGWPGLTPPTAASGAGTVDEATRLAAPDSRADRVRAFIEAVAGLEAAGYCRSGWWSGAYRSSAGHQLHAASSMADMDGIARATTPNGMVDGVARRAGARLAELDGHALGRQAADSARSQLSPVELPPGRYEVILAPEAVADLLVNFASYGFNGKAHNERRSFAELGVAQFDPMISLYDDPLSPDVPGQPFDCEGTPRRRLNLVDRGVTTAVTHDRRTAAVAGTASTGHALPGGASFGAQATNLALAPGSATMPQMIAGMRRGLLVADLWYTRVLDPRQMTLTGLTRNGVWLVEQGEIVSAVSNLRFTQAYPQALAPGEVLAVGAEVIAQPSRWGLGSWSSPALHLASWNFTGGASG
jgi:predicted Zn-dependent protease